MTVQQAIEAVRKVQINALSRAAEVALVTVKNYIPKGITGNLRNETHVEAKDKSVDLVSGGQGSKSAEYASYQYAVAERHLINGKVL